MEPLDQLLQRVNANARLVWRGRYVDTTFLLEVGSRSCETQKSLTLKNKKNN